MRKIPQPEKNHKKTPSLERKQASYRLGKKGDPISPSTVIKLMTYEQPLPESVYGFIDREYYESIPEPYEYSLGHEETDRDFYIWFKSLNEHKSKPINTNRTVKEIAIDLIKKSESILLASVHRKTLFRKTKSIRESESLEERINREKQYKTNRDIKIKAIKERRLEFKYKRPQLLLQMLASGMLYQCATTGCLNEDITIDHKTPIALGGGDEIENMQFLCRSCNSIKGIKLIEKP